MQLFKFGGILILILASLISCGKSSEKSNDSAEVIEQISPQEAPDNFALASVDELMSKNIVNFLTQSYLKNDMQFLTENDRKFQFYKIDLNDDGKDEYFIRFLSSYFCGTGGCTFLLLDNYSEIVTTFTVMDAPIYISKDRENGWNKLLVLSGGKLKELIFDGKSYPSNPSVVANSKVQPESTFEVLFDDEKLPAKTYTY